MINLSVLMITKNPDPIIISSLKSIYDLAKEIVIIDDNSATISHKLLKDFKRIRFIRHTENNLGLQKAFGLKKCRCEWVLSLDSDEVVSKDLAKEILLSLEKDSSFINGYIIPFQNHFLGRPIKYGGENYEMLRLLRRKNALIKSSLVHEHFEIKNGKVKRLTNKIFHYSYRSLIQTYQKFTDYSFREYQSKLIFNESSSLKKLFLYPIHMLYARFIKDKGYKDGLFRIPLDLGFAYMEFLTYLLLFFKTIKKRH